MSQDHKINVPILLVEDNPFNRELLKAALIRMGCRVVEAKNGKEALAKIADSDFRLIFMDLLMPGMDGFETIRRIRRMGVQTPIIIASSMDAREDRRQCLEAGGNDFLPKPIDMREVAKLVRKYASGATASETAPSLADPNPDRFSGFSVLLVEEDPDLAQRRVEFLKQRSFEVVRVSSGDKALVALENRQQRFEIIISNLFTPGIDGMGILARVKRNRPELLVFIYAPEYDKDTFQLALQLGADGVVTSADFENTILPAIESAALQAGQKGSRAQAATTVRQVRQAQANLIRYGCSTPCKTIDIAYSPLTDAGGDLACCRRFNLSNRCGVFLGDVSGHSVISSYLSAFYMGLLTANWNQAQRPNQLLKTINHELNTSDYREYHLCATAILWDRNRQQMEIGMAGNPGALLMRPKNDGPPDIQELTGGGLCLGLLPQDDLFHYEQIRLDPGAFLFLFTDGLNPEDVTAALTSGDIKLNRDSIHGLSQEIVDWILARKGQDDDILLVALKAPQKLPETTIGELHHAFSSGFKGVDDACIRAASIVEKNAPLLGKDPELVMLAIREALINAVQHGNGQAPGAYVDVSLCWTKKGLRIDVSDEGPGFELPQPLKSIESVDVLQSRGRGVAAMRTIADDIEVVGGTVSLFFNSDLFGENQ